MLEIRRSADLGEKTLVADDGGKLRAENLDRDTAMVLEIFGEIDGRHPTLAKLALDTVAVSQHGGQRGQVTQASLGGEMPGWPSARNLNA